MGWAAYSLRVIKKSAPPTELPRPKPRSWWRAGLIVAGVFSGLGWIACGVLEVRTAVLWPDVVAGSLVVAAGLGGGFAWWRVDRRQYGIEREQRRQEDAASRLTELRILAVGQLGSPTAAVRIGGLHNLERLGERHPQLRQSILDEICAYLRAPFCPPAESSIVATASADARQERKVRLTAQAILQRHLIADDPLYWDHDGLNLTGAFLENVRLKGARLHHAVFRGAVFAGFTELHGSTEFTDATFTGIADFREATFRVRVGFTSAVFEGGAYFNSAAFEDEVFAERARFTQGTHFRQAEFAGLTTFNSARFDRSADFRRAVFADAAFFDSANFTGRAEFALAVFTDCASFDSATFALAAGFELARFVGGARFDAVRFACGACFESAVFEAGAGFPRAEFDGEAAFRVARFALNADFGSAGFARRADFGWATFQAGVEFGSARFRGEASFESATFMREADFGAVRFDAVADFEMAELGEEFACLDAMAKPDVDGHFWPPGWRLEPVTDPLGYGKLRQSREA